MAISKKPQNITLVNRVVNKGGSVAGDKNNKNTKMISLNIPLNLIERIDLLNKNSEIPITRNAFILTAILDKVRSQENN